MVRVSIVMLTVEPKEMVSRVDLMLVKSGRICCLMVSAVTVQLIKGSKVMEERNVRLMFVVRGRFWRTMDSVKNVPNSKDLKVMESNAVLTHVIQDKCWYKKVPVPIAIRTPEPKTMENPVDQIPVAPHKSFYLMVLAAIVPYTQNNKTTAKNVPQIHAPILNFLKITVPAQTVAATREHKM